MIMPATEAKPRRFQVKDKSGRIVGLAELRMVPCYAIKIDPSYQRDVKQSWVDAHRPFDPQKAGAVILSDRAGGPYCIDGGHRLAMARADGIDKINALVISGLAKVDEARLFVEYQRSRTNLSSWFLFRAEVAGGDAETAAMVRIVNNAGFELHNKSGTFHITAIDSVRWVHRYGGDDLLRRVLELVKEVWLERENALKGTVLKALGIFLMSAGAQPGFRRDVLVEVLNRRVPLTLLGDAQEIAAKRKASSEMSPTNIAEAIQNAYNAVANRRKDVEPLAPLTISGRKRARSYR